MDRSIKNYIEVSNAFENILKNAIHIGHKFQNVFHTGKGLEFQNNEFNSILKKYILGLQIYHTENEEKSRIIEIHNKTQNENIKNYLRLIKMLMDRYYTKNT